MSNAAIQDQQVEQTLDLKILSQLSGADGTLSLGNVAATTTVAQLKARVKDNLSTHPRIDHLRLIYRGRLLARDNDSLADVLTQETVQQGGTHVLHLVVRDSQTAANGRTPQMISATSQTRTPSSTYSVTNPQAPSTAPLPPGHNVPPAPIPQPRMPAPLPPQQRPARIPTATGLGPPGLGQPQMGRGANPFVQPQTPFVGMNHQFDGQPIPNHQPIPQAMPGLPPDMAAFMQQQMQQHMTMVAAQMNQIPRPTNGLPNTSSTGQSDGEREREIQEQTLDILAAAGVPGVQPRPGSTASTLPEAATRANGAPAAPAPNAMPSAEPSRGEAGFETTSADNASQPSQTVRQEGTGPNGERISVTFTTTTNAHDGAPTSYSHSRSPQGPASLPPNAMPMPPMANFRQPSSHAFNPSFNMQQQQASHEMPRWPGMPPLGMSQEYYGVEHAIDSMRKFQEDLDTVSNRMASHSASLAFQPQLVAGFYQQASNILQIRNRGQQLLNSLLLPGSYSYHQGLRAEDVRTLQSLNATFTNTWHTVVTRLLDLRRIASSDSASQASTSSVANPESQQSSQSRAAPRSVENNVSSNPALGTANQNVTAYLLQTPTGPRAVIFTPNGPFQSQHHASTAVRNRSRQQGLRPGAHRHLHGAPTAVSPTAQGATNGVVRANNALHTSNVPPQALAGQPQGEGYNQHQDPHHNQNQNQNQNQNDNEVNDLLPIFVQAFQHLWLLIRVSGLIWLLTRGATMQRTILLAGVTLVYFAVQAGMFGDRWDRLRRHFEGLLGLPFLDEARERDGAAHGQPAAQPANGQPQDRNANQDPAQAQVPNQAQQASASRRTNTNTTNPSNLTPEATAARLLRNRRDQDRSWIRQRLLEVERGIALFVASLYPGVGERHVAARERAVAEERRARDEAEVQAERARVEAQRAQVEGSGESAGTGDGGGGRTERQGEISADGDKANFKDGESSSKSNDAVRRDAAAGEGSSSAVSPTNDAEGLRLRGGSGET